MTRRVRFAAALVLALGLHGAVAHAQIHVSVETDGTMAFSNLLHGSDAPRADARALPGADAELPFAELVAAAAVEHDVPEALLHAVIRAESNYNPAAVSPRGAVGLMQLMPATARALGVFDLLDPAANVRAGAQYLKQLLGMFGDDVALAVAAYNAGPGAVRRHGGGIPPFAETRRYVPRVMERFRSLQAGESALPVLAAR